MATLVSDTLREDAITFPTECACTALRRAARAVTHLYDLVLSPVGLRATQFIILRAIGEHDEIAQWDLSSKYAVSRDTLSRRLGAMRKAGLVSARMGVRGARVYSLTNKGEKTLRSANANWTRAQARLRDALGGNAALSEAIQIADKLTSASQLGLSMRRKNSGTHKA